MNRRALFTDDRDLAAPVCEATNVVPSSTLLERIHVSRADGMRVMLPSGDAATIPVAVTATSFAFDELSVEQLAGRVWLVGIAVAASLIAAVTALWPRDTATRSLQTPLARQQPATLDSIKALPTESLAESFSPWPRVAYAQAPSAASANAPYASLGSLVVSRLRPGRRSYLRSVGNDHHALLPYSTYTVQLDSADLDKQRVWCLVTVTQTSTGLADNHERGAEHDTVWLRRSDLRPIRRARYAGYLHVRQSFTDSTLVETDSLIASPATLLPKGMSLMPFRHGTTRRLDARIPFVATEASMRLLLRAAPLHERWRASVGVLTGDNRSFAMGEPGYLNLRVDGSHDIQTLSGHYATWRVVLETGVRPEVWYVSKETGETLLTEGSWGVSYPVSETRLLYGFEETKRVLPAGSR